MEAFLLWTALLLFSPHADAAEAKSWLTDGHARDVVASTVHSRYPEPCYSTYRNEHLERSADNFRSNSSNDGNADASVYFYRVASDNCEYDTLQDGKPVKLTLVTMDCCEYGIVAVDRSTAKSYWFTPEEGADKFEEFARDEKMRPDLPFSRLFISFYRELVWGDADEKEISSLEQLRTAVGRNFESAYSPYGKDGVWARKFEIWWRKFVSRNSRLTLGTTYQPISEGTRVSGYSFSGFKLTVPRSDGPPKGKPTLFQWTLLIKSDGTVERLPSKAIYSNR